MSLFERVFGSSGLFSQGSPDDLTMVIDQHSDHIEALEAASGTYVRADGGGREKVQSHGATGATETIDLTNGNVHGITLDANCTLTFAGSVAGVACSFTLVVTQDGTGSRTITWPASVKWAAGTAPTLSTAAAAVDVLAFFTIDNGTTWYGFLSGAGMA